MANARARAVGAYIRGHYRGGGQSEVRRLMKEAQAHVGGRSSRSNPGGISKLIKFAAIGAAGLYAYKKLKPA